MGKDTKMGKNIPVLCFFIPAGGVPKKRAAA